MFASKWASNAWGAAAVNTHVVFALLLIVALQFGVVALNVRLEVDAIVDFLFQVFDRSIADRERVKVGHHLREGNLLWVGEWKWVARVCAVHSWT